MLGNHSTLFLTLFFIGLTFVNCEVSRNGDKITIRTKRQQCVCIVVSQAPNQLQCNCDNNQPSSTPQVQQQQQQELQQQLQQVQAPATTTSTGSQTTCGCVLIVIKVANGPSGALQQTTQHPQYQCQCSSTLQHTVPHYNPPTTTTTLSPTTTTTTTTMRPTTIKPTTTTAVFQQAEPPINNNPCACIQVFVTSGATQYSCDCNGVNSVNAIQQPLFDLTGTSGTNYVQDQNSNQNYLTSAVYQADYFGSSATNQNNYQPAAVTTAYTQQPIVYTQQPVYNQAATTYQPVVAPNYLNSALNNANYLTANSNMAPVPLQTVYTQPQYTNANTNNFQQDSSQFDAEPATTTCISITIPANSQSCLCGNNYVQCADNMCCHKRYRSLKKDEESAMDIIVDVLKNIKDRLDRS